MVKQVKASHILVDKLTDAERLIDKLKGGDLGLCDKVLG